MTTIALLLSLNLSTAWALTCTFTQDPTNEGKYTLSVTGTGTGNTFSTSSCNGQLPTGVSSWSNAKGKITSVSFDNSITSIGESVFDSYRSTTSLTSVDMPNVTSIGNYAFGDVYSLISVNMPNVTTIGAWAFTGTTSLSSIDMPNVALIGEYAFQSTTNLNYVGLPNTGVSISSSAFNLSNVTGCSTSNLANCNYCTNSNKNSSANSNIANGTTIYQPNTTGGSCIAASDCTGEYEVSGGLCKMKPVQSSQSASETLVEETPQQPTTASCANSGKVLQGTECVSSCGSSFRLNDGECDRIRYTPAEAAAVLKDTDNEIIMTFKVNR